MKQTRKIFVAILVLMTILMSLAVVAIPASAAIGDTEIVFNLGADGSATHTDSNSAKTTYSETVNGYTLSITDGTKMYPGSRDAKGNGCIKFGTGSAVGSCKFTVPSEVTAVKIEAAKYKANTSKLSVNGTTYTLNGASNDGVYDEIEVDTSTNKTVSIATVSGGVRAMINSITFVIPTDCEHANTTETVQDPTCIADGAIIETCDDCGAVVSRVAGDPATGIHADEDGDLKCDFDTDCTYKYIPDAGSTLTIAQAINLGANHSHNTYTSGKYYITGKIDTVDNTTYGNIYIVDENGNRFYVYGLYSAENGAVRYDKMTTKPKKGDTITIYTVVGNYNGAQAKNAWIAEHNYNEVVTPPTFDSEGYTTHTCTICGNSFKDNYVPALVAVATADGDKYTTLAEALENGSEIVLLQNIELDAPIVIMNSYVLDLNGYTLSYESTVQGEAMITNKSSLVIKDSSEAGTGVINYNYVGAADSSYGKGNYTISNGGTLTVEGGKITIADLRGHAKYPIDNNSTSGDAILVINGGHLYNYNTSAIRQFCNSTTNKNSVTINGGIIEGYCAIWVQNPGSKTVNGSLAITGGEIKSTAKAYVEGTSELKDVSSRIYFTIDGNGGAWSEDSSISITGGTFNENVNLADNAPVSMTVAATATFNGYIELPEARYNGNNYATLAEALEAAKGETNIVIELLDDVAIDTETFTIPDGVALTLNMNGKKITVVDNATKNYELFYIYGELTVTGNGTIELTATNNRNWEAMSAIFHNRGGILTIENGTYTNLGGTNMAYVVDNSGNYYGDAYTYINDGTLTSSYIGIRNRMEQNSHGASGTAYLYVSGGKIDGARRAIWAQAASTSTTAPATGVINISGGEVGLIDTACSVGAVSMTTITGGTVASFKGEVGELTVNGGTITGDILAYTASGDAVDNFAFDSNGVLISVVAKIGDVYYQTVFEAIAAAKDGDTITLLPGTITEEIKHSDYINRFENKNITIEGAANYGTVLTGGLYIGYDDNNPYTGSVTVKGVVFEGKGLSLVQLDAVSVVDCKFNNISENAIHIIADSITETVTVTGNVIDGATMGIMVRNGLTVVIDGNEISNTDHNSINLQQAHNANTYPITITNNTLSNWGLSAEGRAIRIALGEIANTRTGTAPATKVVNISGNTLVNENAPEEFVKITSVDSSMNVSLTSNILIGSTPDGVEYILLEGNGADSVDTDNNPVVTENQPHILDGYWWIGSTNTGIKAEGIDGEDGKDGADGEDGLTPTFKVENGIIYVSYDNGATWTDLANIKGEDGKDGVDGEDGKDGVDGEDGKDGVDGEDGKDGVDGEDGKDGVDGAPGKDGEDGKDGVDGKDGKDGNDNNQVVITSIAVATVAIIFALGVLLFWRVKRRSWWCIH